MPMKCCICADTKAQIVRLINHSFAALCTVHRQAHAAVIAEQHPDPAVCTKCGAACIACTLAMPTVKPPSQFCGMCGGTGVNRDETRQCSVCAGTGYNTPF